MQVKVSTVTPFIVLELKCKWKLAHLSLKSQGKHSGVNKQVKVSTVKLPKGHGKHSGVNKQVKVSTMELSNKSR